MENTILSPVITQKCLTSYHRKSGKLVASSKYNLTTTFKPKGEVLWKYSELENRGEGLQHP